jgi:SpoVK/Ycf46/Vps4 family AAA+-type ATPase
MAAKVIKGKRTKTAVKKKSAGKKTTTPVRREKKSKATSVAVLVLSGSTALRRRKAAETLAETLKVDLFRVDLSAVMSKNIGETEKNLNGVFDKAEAIGAILFFDEADALFGTGSKGNDAHGRYANAETAHLLQRIESHNGIIILTINGKQRIDQAFAPRTQVIVMAGTTGKTRTKKK